MDYIVLYFILTNGSGYLPPLDVHKINMVCGLAGKIIGVHVNSSINPTKAIWPDPGFEHMHCEINISNKVSSLEPGEYHLATTEMGDGSGIPYIGIDPHTSEFFTVVKVSQTVPSKPITLVVKGQ